MHRAEQQNCQDSKKSKVFSPRGVRRNVKKDLWGKTFRDLKQLRKMMENGRQRGALWGAYRRYGATVECIPSLNKNYRQRDPN